MTSVNYLHYTIEQKENALKLYGRTLESLKEDVEAIKLWLEKQPHIPKNIDDVYIEHFLLENKFIYSNAKKTLDWYFRIRNIYPDYFKGPNDEGVVIALNYFYLYPLPKMTPNSNARVIMSKVKSKTVDPKLDAQSIIALSINLADIILKFDCPSTKVILFDFKNYTVEFYSRFSPITLKILQNIFEKAYHNGIKELHGINLNPVIETVFNVVKTFMNPKLANRIRVHKDLNSLYEFVPKEILPKDYGGDEVSTDEMHELWKKELMRNTALFEERKFMVTDESLRIDDIPDCDVLGVQGNFRKLVVD